VRAMQRLRALPRHTLPLLAATWCWQLFAFYVPKLVMDGMPHHDLSLPADRLIPFVPATILIYVAAFAEWFLIYLYLAVQEQRRAYRFFCAVFLSLFVCFVCFLALPAAITRPAVDGSSLCGALVRLVYRLDSPTNLFPSIHCLLSWLCWRGVRDLPDAPRGVKAGLLVFGTAVCLSTLTTKQHFIVDVLAGVAVAELCWRISAAESVRRVYAAAADRIVGTFCRERAANSVSSPRGGTEARAMLSAVLAHTFWGFSFMASRVALDHAHMFVLLSHRFLLAFALMNLLLLAGAGRLSLRGKRLLPLLMLALAEPVVYFYGEQYGILHSNTIFSGVMIAMIPVVSMLAAAPILKERPTAGQLAFSAVSVAGVIGVGLQSGGSGALTWGGVAGLVVAVAAATAYTLLGRRLSVSFTPFERTYMMMATGAVVFTASALLRCSAAEYLRPLHDAPYLTAICFLGVCCSVGSYFLTSYSITYMTVARETVFANLTTAVSVFAGAFFLREPFSAVSAVFCAMILAGIYGVQRTAREEKTASPEN